MDDALDRGFTRPRPVTGPARWPIVLIFLAGCAAYVASADCSFIKDDLTLSQLTADGFHANWEVITRHFLWPTALAHDQFYRPLPVLFGALDLRLFGADARGFRVCNIGFHALNGVLLALFLNRLTRWRRPAAGWMAGMLFALHPLHGEAVLWITQRMVVQCLTWSLLSLLAFDVWFSQRKLWQLVTCIAATLAAALTKEVTVALPASFVVLAWFRQASADAPGVDRRERLKATARVAAWTLAIPVLILGLRKILFGVWEGTYGNLSPAEYAASRHVFARMGQSLLDGLWAVNVDEVPPQVRLLLGIAWVMLLVPLPLWSIVRSLQTATGRGAAAAFATFAVASFLPTMMIFYIEPTLTNARFLYQPLAGLIGLVAVGFAARDPARSAGWDLAPLAAAVLLFAVAGQYNQRAFDGADRQIRAVRDGVLRETSEQADHAMVVLFGTPADHHGVPTVDAYLPLLLSPPFSRHPHDAFAFVQGQEPLWPGTVVTTADANAPSSYGAWRATGADRPLLHLVYADDPPRVSRLFGAAEPPEGANAPELSAPEDGAVIVCPTEEPTFLFTAVRGAVRYRLHFSVPKKQFVLEALPKTHLTRIGTRLAYRFAQGNVAGLPDMWAGVGATSFASPLPLAWRVEAVAEDGTSMGVSGSRRIVVINGAAAR